MHCTGALVACYSSYRGASNLLLEFLVDVLYIQQLIVYVV